MPPTSDPGLQAVLDAFGVPASALLGRGGEARVYALDRERVLRVSHGRVDPAFIERRSRLLAELRGGSTHFQIPDVLDTGELAARSFTIETRLPGRPVSELLATLDGRPRTSLIERHLEAAARLGDLRLEPRGWFGEILGEPPLRRDTWRGYLRERVATSIRMSVPELAGVDSDSLAEGLPDAGSAGFVHLDAFAGNMLAVGTEISAVIDFGPACVVGDRRLDPLASAVYLLAPEVTPTARPQDRDIVMGWLRSARLAEWYEPARRWLAGYWSFALDDEPLLRWCRGVLVG